MNAQLSLEMLIGMLLAMFLLAVFLGLASGIRANAMSHVRAIATLLVHNPGVLHANGH
ncbi:MAG: hypothetical protein QXY86_01050 [Candidatus Micrarchaeaceae archaeon]